jgi:hypothetical protein
MTFAIVATASLLLGVHATVDAFLAPEPGTGASDHALRWLASIALLLAALVVARRGRDGARALVGLLLGVLAIEATALSIADTLAGGARGEDWTGFLLAPVGPVLIGLGVVLLWRSRQPQGRRFVRRALLAVGSLVAVYWLVLPVVVAIAATHRPRSEPEPPSLGTPWEEVTITTGDGLELAGWYVPSRNGAAIVSFPTRGGKVPQARMLARNGYGVLLLDMRGYDGSEGDPNMFGWGATKDLDAAVDWLERRPDVEDGRIGGLGFSVGGEVLIEAAAANEAIRAVVSEGAGVRSVREAALRGPAGWADLPREAVQTAALAVLSATAPPPSLEDLAARIAPRPLLLIYAARGQGGEDLNPQYFDAAGQPKGIWRVDEGGHTGAYEADPAAYERRVVGFFDLALTPTRP